MAHGEDAGAGLAPTYNPNVSEDFTALFRGGRSVRGTLLNRELHGIKPINLAIRSPGKGVSPATR